jgi:hypothetical protein
MGDGFRFCPNCGADSDWLSYRLNDTVECQNCGLRMDPEAFCAGHLSPEQIAEIRADMQGGE